MWTPAEALEPPDLSQMLLCSSLGSLPQPSPVPGRFPHWPWSNESLAPGCPSPDPPGSEHSLLLKAITTVSPWKLPSTEIWERERPRHPGTSCRNANSQSPGPQVSWILGVNQLQRRRQQEIPLLVAFQRKPGCHCHMRGSEKLTRGKGYLPWGLLKGRGQVTFSTIPRVSSRRILLSETLSYKLGE